MKAPDRILRSFDQAQAANPANAAVRTPFWPSMMHHHHPGKPRTSHQECLMVVAFRTEAIHRLLAPITQMASEAR